MNRWLLIASFLLLLVATSSAKDKFEACTSDNSLDSVTSFAEININKKTGLKPNVYYTLLTDRTNDISVHVKYESCSSNPTGLCNCAVYVKVGNDGLAESKYAFIDFCDANPDISGHLRFYSTTKTTIDESLISLSTSFPEIDCNAEIEDASDPNQWSAIRPYQVAFKCAKLVDPDSECQTSYLQASAYSKTVLIRLDTKCKKASDDEAEYLKSVSIVPPKNIGYETGGLCGNMVDGKCHLFVSSVASLNATTECNEDGNVLGVYWISTSFQRMHLREKLSRVASEFECTTFNYDSSLTTFSSSMLKDKNFRMSNDFNNSLILYDHKLHTMVTTKYNLCSVPYKNVLLCNCAAYVRLNRTSTTHFAFIDVCNLPGHEIAIQSFKHYNDSTASVLPYANMNCSTVIDDENDESEWRSVPTSFLHFKCATLSDNTCTTLVLKTIGEDNSNIMVKVDAHCPGISELDPIAQITVRPSVRSEEHSNGICGKWTTIEQPVCEPSAVGDQACESRSNTLELTKKYNMYEYENSGLVKKGVNNAIVRATDSERGNIINFNTNCKSVNDPYIYGFGTSTRNVFRNQGEFTFYKYDYGIRVTTGFIPCCNCAVFITVDPDTTSEKTIYMDSCSALLPIYGNFWNTPTLLDKKTIDEHCYQKSGDPLSEEIWNGWPAHEKPLLGVFKCIKTGFKAGFLRRAVRETLYLRVVRTLESQKFEALVVIYPGLYTVQVFPSLASAAQTEGLCGNNARSCNLMYRDERDNQKCAANGNTTELEEFDEYWRVKPKTPENSLRGIDPQVRLNEEKSRRKIEELESRMFPRTLHKFDSSEARYSCESEIEKVLVVTDDPQVDQELNDLAEEKIQLCALDLLHTQDAIWAREHANAMKTRISEYIMEKREYFDENLVIKDETLSQFKIFCPNNCTAAQFGKCLKNNNCLFGVGCDYMVKCECNSPYSSSDCSVNADQSPRFMLARKCCDTRTMDCDTITLIGDFSDTEEISVRLESEKDSSTSANFIAELKENKIQVKFPYGKFPGVKESHHRIKIGVTYGKSDYSWQTLDFYDSRCRTCDDRKGVAEQPVKNTCIAKTGVCSTFVTDNEAVLSGTPEAKMCLDPSPCNSAFDVAFIVHSSSYSDEDNYEMVKNSIAEMLGRFNLGRDKVHAGVMYYGRRVTKSTTVARRDQFSPKLTVERAQAVPYVPILASPVSQALRYAKDVVFTKSRTNSQTIPRVAVLVNFKSGDDGDANANANLLKSDNIELLTIGIGNQINAAALNQLASTSPVLVHLGKDALVEMKKNAFVYKYPSDVFKNLPELVSRICTMAAKVELDQPARIEFTERFAKNYFQVDIVPSPADSYVLVKIEELKGSGSFYCSFTNPNPVAADTCSTYKRQARVSETYFQFEMPSSPKTLYFTIESFEAKGDFEVTIMTY